MGNAPTVLSVDNPAWVKNLIAGPCPWKSSDELDPWWGNIDSVSEYIEKNHPLNGCAVWGPVKFKGDEDLKTLSANAHALTVCCYEKLGQHVYDEQELAKDINDTGIGNVAFIALNHSDEAIRKRYSEYVEVWRKKKQK